MDADLESTPHTAAAAAAAAAAACVQKHVYAQVEMERWRAHQRGIRRGT